MGWIIFIIIIICVLGYSDTNTDSDITPDVTTSSRKEERLSRKDIKRIKKAYRQAEMDAFEDAYMYYEVFMDD